MKILLCTNSFENIVNGPAKFANLILQINELYLEHQVRILTEDLSQPKDYVYKVNLRIPKYLKLISQILRMFIYHRHAETIRKEYPYDILVYNNAFIGLWSAIISKTPTVGMINDDNNLSINLSNFRMSSFWIKKMFFKQLEKWSAYAHKKIIANSDYLTKQLIRSYNLDEEKVVKLYKAVDIKSIKFNNKRKYSLPIKVLFVKADYSRGGLRVLIKALSLLKEYSFQLIIIGPNIRYKEQIMTLFDSKTNIMPLFLAEQSQDVVHTYMQTADIFCVPSLQEALGVANIEALAAGIAVISTEVGGIPEILNNGKNGWLVKPNQSKELADAIRDCILDGSLRTIKSENGRIFIRNFSKELLFKRMIHIFEECI